MEGARLNPRLIHHSWKERRKWSVRRYFSVARALLTFHLPWHRFSQTRCELVRVRGKPTPSFPSPFLLFGPRFVSASRIRVRTAGRFNHLHCTHTTSSTLSSFLATRREFQHSFDSLLYARCPRLFRKQRGPLSISPWKSDYDPWSIVAAREFSSFDCRENDTIFIYSNISRIHSPRYIYIYIYLGQRGGKFEGRYPRLKH